MHQLESVIIPVTGKYMDASTASTQRRLTNTNNTEQAKTVDSRPENNGMGQNVSFGGEATFVDRCQPQMFLCPCHIFLYHIRMSSAEHSI